MINNLLLKWARTPDVENIIKVTKLRFYKQVWRYFTYSLVHGSVIHIALNVCGMIIVGLPLELTNRSWKVGLVFTAGKKLNTKVVIMENF